MPKIIKNRLGNFLITFLISILITGWFFSGWPQIWKEPPIPPEIKEARAATKTFLLTNDEAFTGSWQMAESNANPSTDNLTDVKTGKTAVGNYFIFTPGVTNSTAAGTTLPTDCTKTGWRSDSALNGTFAAGNWTFNVRLQNRATYAHAGIVYLRIWKGNSDMTTATAITAWSASPNTISFSATSGEIKTDSFTVSVSETTLSGEYLFVEYAWKITTAGTNPTAGLYFTCDEATGETVVTTDFTPVAVSISLNRNTQAFGFVPLDTPVNNSADPVVITVDVGPATLRVKTTKFTDATYTWELGTSNGDYQVRWRFSKDGSSWTIFEAADPTDYLFEENVPESETRDLHLELLTPTATYSWIQYSATVTITAY